MKVTKIIKEYVEKTVDRKRDAIIASIPEVTPIHETKEFKEKVVIYEEFADQKFDELLDELENKARELGVELVPFHYYGSKLTTYKERMRLEFDPIRYFKNALQDKELAEYRQKIESIRAEYDEKIDSILIGLEIGEIKKQELESMLEEFKI